MDRLPLYIHHKIKRAKTLPGWVYSDPTTYQVFLDQGFVPSWHLLTDVDVPSGAQHCVPFPLLPGSLDEPLLLTCDDHGTVRCLSNACTHRGALVVEQESVQSVLKCPYHGRCFELSGAFKSMPHFQDAEVFPRPEDSLAAVALDRWGPLPFVSLAPACPLPDHLGPITDRLGFAPVDRLELDPDSVRDYTFDANWLLYCDNYLEGLHIPFVHPGLSGALDWSNYRIECFDRCSIQIATGSDPADAFDLPAGHPDHGQSIAAYYCFAFPNLILNAYPWGLSVNVVLPQGPHRTTVQFRSYVWDPARRDVAASASLHQVEMEDEAVVLSAQRGVRSRLYPRGRYSPSQEIAVHHFHRWLADLIP